MRSPPLQWIACWLLLATGAVPALALRGATDPWQLWLDEVAPIISRLERETFRSLGTDEDRRRFQEMFWRVRDPRPQTPENEYLAEFRRRCQVAVERFDGVRSDQGRIYVLLGKPLEVKQYSGYQDLVECQTWSYHNTDYPQLPPFMTLLFYRPRDSGGFKLFYPGLNEPVELLSPHLSVSLRSRFEAYRMVSENSPELAQATLSVIPGEGNPSSGSPVSSSAVVLGEIQRLPEQAASTAYLHGFGQPVGTVTTRDSTRRILGTVHLAVGGSGDQPTLHVAAMPDRLGGKPRADGELEIGVSLYLTLESPAGVVIYQGEQRFDLALDSDRQKTIDQRKVVFVHAIPVIGGRYRVSVTWMNRLSEEFFSRQLEVVVEEKKPRLLAGFASHVQNSAPLFPFTLGGVRVTVDPRFVYTQGETLAGAVTASPTAVLQLISDTPGARPLLVLLKAAPGGAGYFSLPLGEVAAGSYRLALLDGDDRLESGPIRVEPAFLQLPKPLVLAPPPAAFSPVQDLFVRAQEYFNSGDVSQAVRLVEQIGPGKASPAARTTMARIHAAAKQPARVLELLAPLHTKDYATWVLWTNAAIDLGRFAEAATGLEHLRRYEDSASLNRLLAAAYLSQGKVDAAARCRLRAEEIEQAARSLPGSQSPMEKKP